MTSTRFLLIAALAAGLTACGRPTEQGGSQSTTAGSQSQDASTSSMGTPGATSSSASAPEGVSGTNAGGSVTGTPNAAMPSSAPGAEGSANTTSPRQPASGPASS